MKRLAFSWLISLFFVSQAFAQLGSDWSATCFSTPNHNLICDDHDNLMDSNEYLNDSLGHFEKWYFYQDRIIGKGTSYFIIDEKGRDRLFRSPSEKAWLLQIAKRELEPPIWTKWYSMKDGRDFEEWPDFDSEWEKYWSYYALGLLALFTAIGVDVSHQTRGEFLVGTFLALLIYRIWLYVVFDCLNSF